MRWPWRRSPITETLIAFNFSNERRWVPVSSGDLREGDRFTGEGWYGFR